MTQCRAGQTSRALKRGGSRLRADRFTLQLTEAQCRMVIGASMTAWAAGLPFNRFITVAWGLGGIDPKASVAATGAFIKLARDWLHDRGHPVRWTWVQEYGPKYGAHCHLLLHVPAELEELFRPMPKRWARKVLGGVYVARVMQSQRLGMAMSAEANSAAYEAQLLGKVHYMLKCAPAALEAPLGMTGRGHKPWGQSCLVYGKRAGAWQGKGRTGGQ